MSSLDCWLLTFFNAVICITLPKLLSMLSAAKAERATQLNDSETATAYTELAPQQHISTVEVGVLS